MNQPERFVSVILPVYYISFVDSDAHPLKTLLDRRRLASGPQL